VARSDFPKDRLTSRVGAAMTSRNGDSAGGSRQGIAFSMWESHAKHPWSVVAPSDHYRHLPCAASGSPTGNGRADFKV
jgi:hypothetical protein